MSMYPFSDVHDVFDKVYFKQIDELASSGENKDFSNRRPSHAIYNVAKLIERSEGTYRALCNSLALESNLENAHGGDLAKESLIPPLKLYTHPYIEFLFSEAFLRGVNFRICVAKVPEGLTSMSDHPLVHIATEIRELGLLKGSLEIRQVDLDQLPELYLKKNGKTDSKSLKYNFIVSDLSAFRIETNTCKAEATVNYGSTERAKAGADSFDLEIWTNCFSDPLVSIN